MIELLEEHLLMLVTLLEDLGRFSRITPATSFASRRVVESQCGDALPFLQSDGFTFQHVDGVD